ncbi:MAG: aminodeoxychorismate synthase component I [Verrucomicrobia bacterium]|nr:aminodeoxychorismate synthase component I [Verrucomicrobiota bacterium]
MNLPTILIQGEPAWNQPAWLRFENPTAILTAHTLDEVLPLLQHIETANARGQWAVGFLTYEAAPAFDSALAAHTAPADALPLAWFAIFDTWQPAAEPSGDAPPLHLTPQLDKATYCANIEHIKAAIARGETYQVNYTFPLHGCDPAPPLARFAALSRAQRSQYAAFIETPDFAICSASPELFFLQTGDHITCRPMKGTAPRGRWLDEDQARAAQLQRSTKDRAENIMIVDMMRNDLGRIAEPGAVHAPHLFQIERFPTIWQMTSTIQAQTPATLTQLFRALFPCASITGAPKIQTTKIIRALEPAPRGIYTGAIGIAGPNRHARFNVAIRTLHLQKSNQRATYSIGSGIIWDSHPDNEYAESPAKALILDTPAPFALLTTLRWEPHTGCPLWPRHIARLRRAAEYFGYPFHLQHLQRTLDHALAAPPHTPQRIRISLDPTGHIAIERAPLPDPVTNPTHIALARTPIDTRTPYLFHKTTRREHYAQKRAEHPDAHDVLLWNESQELTETTIANIAIHINGRWTTPPIASGLLPGVMREELLARGDWIENPIPLSSLAPNTPLQLANALRGVWTATLATE